MTTRRSGWSPGSEVRAGAITAACGLAAGLLLTGLVWSALAPEQRRAVATALRGQVPAVVATAVVLAVGLGALVAHLLGRHLRALRMLASDARLLEANREHRISSGGPAEVRALAEAVAGLAERRRRGDDPVHAGLLVGEAGGQARSG